MTFETGGPFRTAGIRIFIVDAALDGRTDTAAADLVFRALVIVAAAEYDRIADALETTRSFRATCVGIYIIDTTLDGTAEPRATDLVLETIGIGRAGILRQCAVGRSAGNGNTADHPTEQSLDDGAS